MRRLAGIYLASALAVSLLLAPVSTAVAGTGSSGSGPVSAVSLLGSQFEGDVVGEVGFRELEPDKIRIMVGPSLAVQQLKSTNVRAGEELDIYLQEGAVVAGNLAAILYDPVGYVLSFYDDNILVSLGVLPDPQRASPAQRSLAPLLPLWIRVIYEPHVA